MIVHYHHLGSSKWWSNTLDQNFINEAKVLEFVNYELKDRDRQSQFED